MKAIYIWVVCAALLMGVYAHVQDVAAVLDMVEEDQLLEFDENSPYRNRLDGINGLYDPVYGVDSPQVTHPPLKVQDPQYDIPRGTPFFRCYFKQNKPDFKFEVKKAWISYEFVDQEFSPVQMSNARVQEKKVQFSEVFPGIDVRYTVKEDCVLEEIIVSEARGITEVVQKIKLHGVTPVEEGKGIYFTDGDRYLFGIPPPVMYELGNPDNTCTGLHYELEFENNQYYLKKVIDEEGISWLDDPDRKYPVVIDATTQSFEDAWESSGLQPYGQYFENIYEYVSPTTGSLTVKQTDFFLPGRGLDLSFTRVYTTPSIFSKECQTVCAGDPNPPEFEDAPYQFECPPVNVGNGWQLNFPWVGQDYIHFLNGTLYQKRSSNHIGDHFTFNNNILTTADGTEYQFSDGKLLSITDVDGNTITFGYSNGKLTTITDTVGRLVNLSYNSYDQLTQISYQDYTVTYSYTYNALTSVTDSLGRATWYTYDTYKNDWLMTRINYPTGGYTDYNYSYYAQEGQCYYPGGQTPYETEYRKYHVINQAVHTPSLAKNSVYSYQGDFDCITQTTVTMKNEQNIAQSYHQFDVNSNGLTTHHTIYDTSWNELVKTDYTHSSRKEVLQKDMYRQGVYCYTEKYLYDSWGNVIYQENGEGEKVYSSYANTNYSKIFRDYTGNIGEFSNTFYDNSIQSTIHTALIGSARIQGDKTIETYCQYDSKGHLLDMHQLFYGTINSSTFQDTFDESGSTSFLIDLTGVTLQGDATLKIQGVPHTNYETKTETHSKYKYCNWLNEGYWEGANFYAEYVTKDGDPQQGYEPIGPFEHYPGTPGYQSYTKWVSVYTQYVKTTYNEYTDKYPEQVEYNLNGNPWEVLSTNLGGSKAYCSIPAEEFISGENTLYFRESSSWTTEFDWVLYVPHAVSPIEDVSTSFAYDGYGNVISITDSLNNTTTLGYDTQYHAYLATITNALNNTTTASYDLSRGFLTSITDAKGNTTSFEYDILGRVTKKIHPDLTELEAVYDDENNVTTIYDELDNYMKRYYDGIGRIIKQEWYLTDTQKLTETYDQNYLDKVKSKTDPEGDVYTYEYDPLGRIIKIFSPDSSYKELQYTDITNVVTIFDENQHKKEYQYNWVGRLLKVREYTDSVNYYLTEYTYDSGGHLTSFTDANGNTTSYEYNSLFGVTSIAYPDLTTETFSFDAAGNVIQKTDALGTTTFTYDAIYQLLNVQYPDQSIVSYQYDENGNRISMTDPEGTTSYTYDERNRLLSQTRTILSEQYTVSYQYDAASELISMTYPDQTTVSYEYDSLNRMTNIQGYAQFTYSNSLLSSTLFANNVETSYQYDNRDRPTTLHTVKDTTDLLIMNYQYDPTGNITQLEYNKRLPDQTWEQSLETFSYDWLDRLISAQDEYGSLSYTHDPVGNRLSKNDISYSYNEMNELLSYGTNQSDPWWDSNYQYRKEITFGTDHDTIPEGYTCTFTMDTTVAALQSGDDIRIVYQTDTQMTELDRIGDVWNNTNTEISFKMQSEIPANLERGADKYYVYYGNTQAGQPPADPQNIYVCFDNFNRADSQDVSNGWIEDEQGSTLSLYNGQLKIEENQNEYAHIEHPISEDNIEVTCKIKPDSYAGWGWAPSIDLFWNDNNGGNHAQIMVTSYNGKLGGKIVADGTIDATFLDGVVSLNQYNWVRIRVTSDTIYFDYGGTGDEPVWVNKLSKSRPTQLSGAPSKIILGKGVEQESYTNPDLDNNYGTPENIGIQYMDDITAKKYILNPPEPVLQSEETEGGGGGDEVNYTFTYDNMGNIITKTNGTDTWSYTYERNQLVRVEKNQQTLTEYTYDGDGKRITKTEWIENLQEYHTKIYVYSGLQVVYEKNITTGQEASYVYGHAGKIAKNVNNSTDFYHSDHLRSTRLITDENGDVLTTVEYNPFGEDTITGEKESYTYTGKEKDSSGLYYYGARYYDPEIGRFISRDLRFGQKRNPKTLNRYIYCLNNPLKYIDPDGNEVCYSNPYKQLKEKDRVLQYSNAPQFLQYVEIDHLGGKEFFYLCVLIGIVLAGMCFFSAIMLWPSIGPALVSLAKALASAGSKVASAVLAQLGAAKAALAGLTWKEWVGLILAIKGLIGLFEDIFDLEIDLDVFKWGIIGKIIYENGNERGFVYIFGEGTYQWRSEIDDEGNRIYYALIDGEWVEMPEEWEPGDPLPSTDG